jgi:hypothetical protein
MSRIFLHQEEARNYVASITDAKERLLVEAALSRAIGFWLADPGRESLHAGPIDLLAFVRGIGAFLHDRAVLDGILSGRLTSMEDI